jgi:uncharacterized membrane protein
MSEANPDTEIPDESTPDFEIRTNLYRAALGLFALLALVAVVQLYASVNATINTFIADRYRPLFRAAFNLVVLLVSGIGISWCVRELSGE